MKNIRKLEVRKAMPNDPATAKARAILAKEGTKAVSGCPELSKRPIAAN